MIKLKYTLEVEGNTVTFNVLEQHPSVCDIFEKNDSVPFKASNGVDVCSMDRVELDRDITNSVFLIGEEDGIADSITFETNKEAVIYAAKVHEALEEWASDWEGWKEITNEPVKEHQSEVVLL
jgi:hypothetical protein